ncbi:DUF262 domain-containing protein [Arthrobacter sp. NPDC080082]|uniref:DUF262 domain-containing protein n=1 Tax=Arthrobacter sp. NPDC080082 TaxID=3155916 RepID=UPI00342D8550
MSILLQLRDNGQLNLAPAFQRNSVWPRNAKAYLIDTILSDRPVPVLYFERGINLQTGRPEYTVIDGQQRMRAVFDFVDGRFSLTESSESPWSRKKWKTLTEDERARILNYDFIVEELSGYKPDDIRDMFGRMNRFVVRLNQQERRRAKYDGFFKEFVEEIAGWEFWRNHRIVSEGAANRQANDELVAELIILLLEGPQDKKDSVDFYYEAYSEHFEPANELRDRLKSHLRFLESALPNLRDLRLHSKTNFYSLIGALDKVVDIEEGYDGIDPQKIGASLIEFANELDSGEPRSDLVEQYVFASSRQTDNLMPRETRIRILTDVIAEAR